MRGRRRRAGVGAIAGGATPAALAQREAQGLPPFTSDPPGKGGHAIQRATKSLGSPALHRSPAGPHGLALPGKLAMGRGRAGELRGGGLRGGLTRRRAGGQPLVTSAPPPIRLSAVRAGRDEGYLPARWQASIGRRTSRAAQPPPRAPPGGWGGSPSSRARLERHRPGGGALWPVPQLAGAAGAECRVAGWWSEVPPARGRGPDVAGVGARAPPGGRGGSPPRADPRARRRRAAALGSEARVGVGVRLSLFH